MRPPTLRPWRILPVAVLPAVSALLAHRLAPPQARTELTVLTPLLTLALLAGVFLHRTLSRRLGALPAIFALATGLALLAFSLALLTPNCPSRTAYAVSTRCTPAEAAQLSLATMLAPLAVFVVLAPLAALLRLLRNTFSTRIAPRLSRRRPAPATRPLKRQTPR